jgi:hypothetical protein
LLVLNTLQKKKKKDRLELVQKRCLVSKYLFDRFSYSDFDKSKGGSVGSRSSFKAPAFKAVMEDKILMSSFRAYCESVHKTEFLEFLEKVFIFVRVRFFFFFF